MFVKRLALVAYLALIMLVLGWTCKLCIHLKIFVWCCLHCRDSYACHIQSCCSRFILDYTWCSLTVK